MSHYSLLLGDAAVKLKGFPDDSVDLTVTSPPYDGLRTYNGYSFDFESIAKELYRVTKPGGVVVWVVGDQTKDGTESGNSFRQALFFKECGFNLHDTMIYASEKPPLTHNRYEQKFEYMFVLSKGKPKTFNPIKEPCIHAGKSASKRTFRQDADGVLEPAHKDEKIADTKIKGNIWTYATGTVSASDPYAKQHPAIFPEKLAEDHILSWSNPGDLVLDPMAGSGTTGKMALKNGRNFVGIDLSEKYLEIAKKRIDLVLEPESLPIADKPSPSASSSIRETPSGAQTEASQPRDSRTLSPVPDVPASTRPA
jgi:site-specific DNA-methyltransferase (adenine-specific)